MKVGKGIVLGDFCNDAVACALLHAHNAVASRVGPSVHGSFLDEHTHHQRAWGLAQVLRRLGANQASYMTCLNRMPAVTSGGSAGYVPAVQDDFPPELCVAVPRMLIAVCTAGELQEGASPYAFAIAPNGMIHTSNEPGDYLANPHSISVRELRR